jgi:hypothetical protein
MKCFHWVDTSVAVAVCAMLSTTCKRPSWWRSRALSLQAKATIAAVTVVYITVCCYLFATVYTSRSKAAQHNTGLKREKYLVYDPYLAKLQPMRHHRRIDNSEPQQASSNSSWFGGLLNWFRHGPSASSQCEEDDCVHFKFPDQLPENVHRVCGDSRTARVPLVVIVSSPVDGFAERQALRDTWLSPKRSQTFRVHPVQVRLGMGEWHHTAVL